MKYLHIGNGATVKKEDVIGIFDLDSATVSQISKKFIADKKKEGAVSYEDSDLPRSFVLVGDKNSTKEKTSKIKLSRISPDGLKKRIEETDIE